jgi:hypothetical protein
MRISFYCLTIAIVMRLLFEAATGQGVAVFNEKNGTIELAPDISHAFVLPGRIALEWFLVDEHRVWLEIHTADKNSWPKDGWHPSFTSIISQYKPLVNKTKDGKWEITFTSGETKEP